MGVSGKLLWDTLASHGIDADAVYRTNSLLCLPPKGPTAKSLAACGNRLWGEIGALENRRVILALGSHAVRAIRDDPKAAVSKLNGVIEWSDIFECWVVYAYHPAFVLRSVEAWSDFAWAVGRAARMLADDAVPPELPELPYEVMKVNDEHRLWAAEHSDVIVCDLETDGLDPRTDPILEIGLRWRDHKPIIIPRDIFMRPSWHEALTRLFGCHEIIWVGHNYKFDTEFLIAQHKFPAVIGNDTMLMHYALDERTGGGDKENGGQQWSGGAHDLKTVARYYLDWPDWSEDVDHLMKLAGGHMSGVPADLRRKYQAYDLEATWRLYWILSKELDKEEPSRSGFWTPKECLQYLVIPASNTLRDIELRGIHVSRTRLDELEADYRRQSAEAKTKARMLSGRGEDFNIRSSQQVAKILYSPRSEGGLGYPNMVSTDRFTLQQLQADDKEAGRPTEPFLASVITSRSLDHTISLYLTGIRNGLDGNDDLHTSIKQHRTLTGRLSSGAPNLQNLPAKSRIKTLFVARFGYTMWNADYKQLEVRMLALMSRCKQLCDDLRASDFHWTTCHRYFPAIVEEMEGALSRNDLEPLERLAREGPGFFADFWRAQCNPAERIEDVGKLFDEMKTRIRRQAKYVTFGPMYGEGAKALASPGKGIGCTEQEAQGFLDNWKRTYPEAFAYLNGETRNAKDYGWVESIHGRRRRFAGLRYGLEGRYATESRNQPIQAGASDLNVMAMTILNDELPEMGLGWPLMPVHDSILGETPTLALAEGIAHVRQVMTSVIVDDDVVFDVDIATGTDWGKCK